MSMSNIKWKRLSVNDGGVENWVGVSEENELVCVDLQNEAVNQEILDSCKEMRNSPHLRNPDAAGFIAGRIPITTWVNWRREWMKAYQSYYTWQGYMLSKLNSREYAGFRCIDGEISAPKAVLERNFNSGASYDLSDLTPHADPVYASGWEAPAKQREMAMA